MKAITKTVAIYGIYFLIWLTATNSFQTTLAKIFEEKGDRKISPFNFLVNYIFYMIGSLFAPRFAYSYRRTLSLVSIVSTCRFALGFFMFSENDIIKYVSSGLGAAILGLAQSVLWVCAGKYIHDACHKFGKVEEKGHYYGLFNSIYNFNSLIAGFVATFGLELLSDQNYFFLVSAVSLLSLFFVLAFVKDINNDSRNNCSQMSLK